MYIGNQPTSTAFVTDTFSGNGTTTAFTMSVAPAGTTSLLVAITGVVQDPSAYSVTGTTLTFSSAPPTGTGNISVRYLGIPASGVTTTAYRTVTEFTATAGQTTFTPPSYTVGYLNVYRNGVLLGSADYTATNGTTVVLAAAASAGDLVTTESFYVSSVLNALPTSGGTLNGNLNVIGDEYVSGNVGIGTSSPAAPLDVVSNSGSTGVNIRGRASDNFGSLYFTSNASIATEYAFIQARPTVTYFYTVGSNPLALGTNSTERMRIDANGNVGIGTSSPTDKLNIVENGQGTVWSGSAVSTPCIILDSGVTSGGYSVNGINFKSNATNSFIYNYSQATGNSSLSFGTASTERMRIDSSGNVGIGTSSPAAKVDVVGGIKSSGTNGFITSGNEFNFASNYNTNNNGDLYINYQGAAKTLVRYMFQRGDASGTYIPLLASAFTVSSDYRIKSNVTPLESGALDKIGKLNPVTYNLFDETKTSIGLIAHEVQKIIPEAVVGEKDAIDEDGEDSYQSVDYSQVAMVLVKAIQEQQEIISDLKARIEVLESK